MSCGAPSIDPLKIWTCRAAIDNGIRALFMLTLAATGAPDAAVNSGIAQQRQSVDLQVPVSPEPVRTDRSLEFVYELHVRISHRWRLSSHVSRSLTPET